MNPGGSDQTPEEVLCDKLAEQADAVTSELRDLLPDSKPVGIEERHPVASVVETATPSGELVTSLSRRTKSVAGDVPVEPPADSGGRRTSDPRSGFAGRDAA